MKTKMLRRMYLLLVLVLIVAGCGTKKDTTSDSSQSNEGSGTSVPDSSGDWSRPETDKDKGAEDDGGSDSQDGAFVNYATGRKLIKNAYLNIETKEFDVFITAVTDKIAMFEGYIETSRISGNSYKYTGNRSAYISARIPADRLDEFIEDAGELGNVTSKEISTDDVTLEYVDAESRKKSLTTEHDRLLAILEKAEKLEDIIAIEKRLSEVRYQLENMESQIRTYDNLVAYSTVSMQITEVERITETDDKTMWDKIRTGFLESMYNIGNGFKNFAVWFISTLPYMVVWIFIIGIIALAVRKILKKSGLLRGRFMKEEKDKKAGGENKKGPQD